MANHVATGQALRLPDVDVRVTGHEEVISTPDREVWVQKRSIPEQESAFFFELVHLDRKRVRDDVDAEFGVVFGQEAFVSEVVVPFAAVIFVAV